MNEAKLYKNQEPEPQSANEAAMAYESSCRNVDDFIASLPKEKMRNLVDFAIEDFVSLLEKVDSLFGKAVATKVKYKISSHINLLASFPCMGMRDFYFSDDKYDVRYLINTPNVIYYAISRNEILIISILDTRQSPEMIRHTIAEILKQSR